MIWRDWILPMLQPWKWPKWFLAGYDGSSRIAREVYEERSSGTEGFEPP